MATLTRLLQMSMVANRRFGRWSNEKIRFSEGESLVLHWSISSVDNEKNATSEPEIRADINNSTKREMLYDPIVPAERSCTSNESSKIQHGPSLSKLLSKNDYFGSTLKW